MKNIFLAHVALIIILNSFSLKAKDLLNRCENNFVVDDEQKVLATFYRNTSKINIYLDDIQYPGIVNSELYGGIISIYEKTQVNGVELIIGSYRESMKEVGRSGLFLLKENKELVRLEEATNGYFLSVSSKTYAVMNFRKEHSSVVKIFDLNTLAIRNVISLVDKFDGDVSQLVSLDDDEVLLAGWGGQGKTWAMAASKSGFKSLSCIIDSEK